MYYVLADYQAGERGRHVNDADTNRKGNITFPNCISYHSLGCHLSIFNKIEEIVLCNCYDAIFEDVW